MKKRFVQVLLYAVLTIGFLVFAVAYDNGIHKIDAIETSYFGAQRWLFLSAAVLLGVGLSIRKKFKADAWFLSALGGCLLAACVVLFLQYGGLTAPFDAAGYAAANVQLIILDGAAVACFVRCAALCGGLRDATTVQKWVARPVCLALAALMLCLIITGYGTRFVQYDQTALEAYEYSEY